MKNTIVAFHIGRGGRFNNPGFLTYLGEKKIGEFTDDLFLSHENYHKIAKKFRDHENLTSLLQQAEEGNKYAIERLEAWGFDLGQELYVDCNGRHIGLTLQEEETGIGYINIDNEYDTTFTKLLSDCSEGELETIRKSEFFTWLSSDCQEYIKCQLDEPAPIEENEDYE